MNSNIPVDSNAPMDSNAAMDSKKLERIQHLQYEIATWRSNSQSNPGAFMHLRSMVRELERLKYGSK